MKKETIIQSLRERKSRRVQRSSPELLFSVRQVCELVKADVPVGIDPDRKLSMLCCFEGVFFEGLPVCPL